MRKLVILRGAMGSGKSTFIEKNNLDMYTLSLDKIRLMFNSLEMTNTYTEMIPQFNNQKVWDLLYYLLEERMKKGEFTIIDAVHDKRESFSTYKKLAEKYRYRLYVVDFSDISKEELYERNKNREGYKRVPENSINRAVKNIAKDSIPKAFKAVKPDDFSSIYNTTPRNLDKYRNIHIIGDIHGCFSCLESFFSNNPFSSDDYYIFVGDYFDRGIENYATLEYLENLANHENVLLLIGNHEDKLYKYACDDEFVYDYDIKNTIEEFEKTGVSKTRIRGFVKQLSQIAFITFREKKYLITHGGIPYFPSRPLDFYSTNSFIYGSSKFEDNIDELYSKFMLESKLEITQIHGHRNFFRIKSDEYPYSYNLEGDIEHGGYLRVFTLRDDGTCEITEEKNNIYNVNHQEESNVYNMILSMRKDRYIFEKVLEDGLSSFNFSKEAFYNRVWNNETIKARGLFIDTKNYHIAARSYDKFFNIGEREETKINHLKTSFNYPVAFYLKYNGFLGLLSTFNGELFFATKSTNTGEYVEYFKNIFYQLYSVDSVEKIKKYLNENRVTLVFEVIDHVNDPHIIAYSEDKLILLDIISNTLKFSKKSYEELQTFAKEYSLNCKRRVYVAKDAQEFDTIMATISDKEYQLEGEYVEGFVLEDSANYMVKFKTDYYVRWKRLRNKMEKALISKNFDTKCEDSLERDFMGFLKDKYSEKETDLSDINIITERSDFYNKLSEK